MKVTFTKQEVLDIVLQYALTEFPRAELNTVSMERYCDDIVVSYVEPAPKATDEANV